MTWVDSENLMVFTGDRRSFICRLDQGTVQQFFEDSTWAAPIEGGKYLCYQDFHKGKRGICFVQLHARGKAVGKETRILTSAYGVSADLRTWIYMKRPGEFWRTTLPGGNEERIGAAPPLAGWDTRINNKGTKIIYRVDNVTLKLVLLENLFE
jgi:hypothetical protein